MLRSRWYPAMLLMLLLVALQGSSGILFALGGAAGADGGVEESKPPLIGVTRAQLSRDHLIRDTTLVSDGRPPLRGAGSTKPGDHSTTQGEIRLAVAPVPDTQGSPWFLRTYVTVTNEDREDWVKTLVQPPVKLHAGTNELTIEFVVDADKLKLPPGNYTIQTGHVAGLVPRVEQDLDALLEVLVETDGDADFGFAASKPMGMRVLGEAAEEVARLQTMIDSQDPDAVMRGVSGLVQHWRLRERPDLAERVVWSTVDRYREVPEVDRLRHVMKFWATDDIAQQREFSRAVQVLDQEREERGDAPFLGEPFGSRALIQEARLWKRSGDVAQAIGAYDEWLDQYADLERWPQVRVLRGLARVDAGDLVAAREDFAAVTEQQELCGTTIPGDDPDDPPVQGGPCPEEEVSEEAQRWVKILDSSRQWYRDDPQQLIAEIVAAFESGDIAALDALVNPFDFSYSPGFTHPITVGWEGPMRSFFEGLIGSASLEFLEAAQDPDNPGMIPLAAVEVSPGGVLTDTNCNRMEMSVENTVLGWQFGGFGCSLMGQAWIPPGLLVPPQEEPVNASPPLKAPWAKGTHMRAGGAPMTWYEILDKLNPFNFDQVYHVVKQFLAATDFCGAGVPGLYYSQPTTHLDDSRFAIDYVRGATAFCFKRRCIPGLIKAAQEMVTVLLGLTKQNEPVKFGAWGDPVMNAYPGIAIDMEYDVEDGRTADKNRIYVAGWTPYPRSAAAVSADLVNNFQDAVLSHNAISALNSFVDKPKWLFRYLHLRQETVHPSLGMWLEHGVQLGRIDDTGKSKLSHLHFEARVRPEPTMTEDRSGIWEEWKAVTQIIEGDWLRPDENGKCIKSRNEAEFTDLDQDGIGDSVDNCTRIFNPSQTDSDGNLIGDLCETEDRDNDGIPDLIDACPDDYDWIRVDSDGDGVLDGAVDSDGDGTPNACDPDADGDGVLNANDTCEGVADCSDTNGDGAPDGCDDLDQDFIPDACDDDKDGDGIRSECSGNGFVCPCQPDVDDTNPGVAGDYDGDGFDRVDEGCDCDHVNPGCAEALAPIEGAGMLEYMMLNL